MTGEEALFIESGIREGVFILLFISVWRAILGPLTSSWAGSGECRAIKGNQVCTFPSCRKAPPSVLTPNRGIGLEWEVEQKGGQEPQT